MPAALQIRRGLRAGLPSIAALGEPLIATDTRELFIGTGSSVYKVGDLVFSTTAPVVEKEKVWINTTNNSMYRASEDCSTWIALLTTSGVVTTDFQVYGVTQGAYSDGNTITAGTLLEDVVKNMLQTIIPPTYIMPSLSIVGSGIYSLEAGTAITPVITPTWQQRDGGSQIAYELRKGGIPVVTNPTAVIYNDTAQTIGDTSISYQATQTFNQGPVKNDNQGNAYPVGQIAASIVISNTVTYIGRRNLFYGVNTSVIRTLANSILGPANGTTFTISIPAGTTSVVIAYPATLQDLTSVKYVELGNGEVKDTFVQSTELVAGAEGYAAVSYKVYTYIPAVPFGDAVTYQGVI
jgi:hypothetical protein